MMITHNNSWEDIVDTNPFWKQIKLNLEEGIENINWTVISRRRNIWFCNERNYENINNIKVSENCKQWMLVICSEDKEGFHAKIKAKQKLLGKVPIIELASEKKEVIHTKSIKKFISKENMSVRPNLGPKAAQEAKQKI